MISKISHITVLVKDQDDALDFYIGKLGFEKRTDQTFDGMRWLTVGPRTQQDLAVSLVKADRRNAKYVGKQTGDIALFTIETDDCKKEYDTLKSKGVKFVSEPKDNPWGMDALLKDLYGNLYDLVQPKPIAMRAAMKTARHKR